MSLSVTLINSGVAGVIILSINTGVKSRHLQKLIKNGSTSHVIRFAISDWTRNVGKNYDILDRPVM